MAKVTLPAGGIPGAFNDHVGQHGKGYFFQGLEIEIPQLTQAVLDAALITYTADVTNINDDFADKIADEIKDRDKDAFDDKTDLTALIKEMVDQLNELRALHALPALNFGVVNADIRNRIGQP